MLVAPTPIYLESLRHAHESHLRAVLYDLSSGSPVSVGELPVTTATLTYDGKALVQRSVDIEFGIDPWMTESRDTIERISTEAGLVTLEHGIAAPGTDLVDWVLLATMRVDSVSAGIGASSRTLYAFDRSILPKEHLLETIRPLNDTYVNLIETMLQETLPGEVLTIAPGFDAGDLALSPSDGKSLSQGGQRLSQMQDLADVIDGKVGNTADGGFILRPNVPPGGSVWTVNAGDEGVLIGGLQETSRREQFNAVSITWTPDGSIPDDDWTRRIYLFDIDPASPTYYDGPFGKRPIYFDEEYSHLPTKSKAERLARTKLALYTGMSRSLEIEAVYNPLLEPGDTITIVFPETAGGPEVTETHIIDAVTFELGPTARMSIQTRLDRPATVQSYVIGSASGMQVD